MYQGIRAVQRIEAARCIGECSVVGQSSASRQRSSTSGWHLIRAAAHQGSAGLSRPLRGKHSCSAYRGYLGMLSTARQPFWACDYVRRTAASSTGMRVWTTHLEVDATQRLVGFMRAEPMLAERGRVHLTQPQHSVLAVCQQQRALWAERQAVAVCHVGHLRAHVCPHACMHMHAG